MKIRLSILAILPCATLLAQGPLTPPGAPAPTMKTLQQVEPRTDLATVPGSASADHVIDTPGSYYLSGNLNITKNSGIEIRSSGVTLDLMGFRLSRSALGLSDAIKISLGGLTDITIRNGHISGPNIRSGIFRNSSPQPINIRVTRVSVSDCSFRAIDIGTHPSASVDHCSVHDTGDSGIRAGEVSYSTAIGCGGTAILASGNVANSQGTSTGGDGINADRNVTNSTGTSTGGDGIFSFRTISYSYGESTGTGDGLNCAIAIGCTSFGGENIDNKYNMP